MPTRQEYLDMAQRADAAGDTEAARQLVAYALQAPEVEDAPEPIITLQEDVRAVEPEWGLAPSPETVAEERAMKAIKEGAITDLGEETERQLAAIERERGRVLEAGGSEPVDVPKSGLVPMFRPTRIRLVEDDKGNVVRKYLDPDTGDLRDPTPGEELWESFAQQQVMTEAEARKTSLQIREGLTRGELGPLVSDVLTTREEGVGVVETPVGATLRGALGALSNLAAEGYFDALGYEVDEHGMPVDEDDIGYAIAEIRRDFGLPETISPSTYAKAITTIPRVLIGEVVGEEASQAVSDFVDAIPQVVVPLPGVATERTQVKTTTYDPDAKRRASDDPDFARRLARNIASGRTIADEFLDTPAVREEMARRYGDEDWAYWAGFVGDIAMPAGPGTAARATRGAAKLGLKSKPALKAAEALISSAEKAGKAPSMRELKGLEKAMQAPNTVYQALADVAAVVVPGRASDARVARAVSLDTLRRLGRSDADITAARAALAEVGVTDEMVRAGYATDQLVARTTGVISRALDLTPDELGQYRRLVKRSMPDDLVMVTDSVAVPRAIAPKVRAIINSTVKEYNVRTPEQVGSAMMSLADEVSQSIPKRAEQMRTLIRKGDKRSIKQALGVYSNVTGKTVSYDDLTVRSPRELAERLRGMANGLSDELTKYGAWDDVPTNVRLQVQEALRSATALEASGPATRFTRDLTSAQVALKSTFDEKVSRRMVRAISQALIGDMATRRAAAVLRAGDRTSVAARKAEQAIRNAAQGAYRTLSVKLSKLSKELGSVDTALSRLLVSETDLTAEQAWRRVLDALYGGDRAETIMLRMADEDLFPVIRAAGIDDVITHPTPAQVRAIVGWAADKDVVPNARDFATGFVGADVRKAFLQTILEEGTRKSIAAKGKAFDAAAQQALRTDAAEVGFDMYDLERIETLERASLVPAGTKTEVVPGTIPFARSLPSRTYDTTVSHMDRVLSESAEEFAELFDSVDVRRVGDATGGVLQFADKMYQKARAATSQLKYGIYGIPNFVGLSYRALEGAVIPLMTIGLQNTLKGALQGGLRTLNRYTNSRMLGTGLTTPDGFRYSPEALDSLALEVGIGQSRVDMERVGQLADDLLDDAVRASGGRISPSKALVLDRVNPISKGFWTRVAGELNWRFRQGVFEAALADGKTVQEAADLARKSQLDYSAAPSIVRETAAKYFTEAGAQYGMYVELAQAITRNPDNARMYLKAQRERQRQQDPELLYGDRGLNTIGIVPVDDDVGSDEYRFFLPQDPLLSKVESTINMARNAHNTLAHLYDAYSEAQDTPTKLMSYGEVLTNSGAEIAMHLAPEITSIIEAVGRASEAGVVPEAAEVVPMSDEEMFWSLATAAHWADPAHEGYWKAFRTLVPHKAVKPPAEYAAKSGSWLWIAEPPEGIPHVYMGKTPQGADRWYVLEPTEQGLKNLQAIRAATPDALQSVFGVLGSTYFQTPGVEASSVLPTGPAQAAARAVLAPAGPTDTARAERARREAVRAVREEF
jgi:hypothetical protein